MNFFEAQDRARRRTGWLVLWFAMGMAGTVVALYFAAVVILKVSGQDELAGISWWDPGLFGVVSLAGGGVIGIGSVSKLLQLSGGGKVVARDLGGRPVDPSTSDTLERRLLNVVEEMSIASGVPVPQVWIMDDEPGINAFAAGNDPGDAVIGVTRGCLEQLDRAQLQGVIGHEFSHILNGDMRLNLRLIGWIFGLVMVAMLGRGIFSMLRHVRIGGGSRNDKNSGGIVLAVMLVGAALWLIGSIGSLFAKLIQAAVSRQREFLADASAVQFTRDPDGLAGALRKIGSNSAKGHVAASGAAEARHLFFASSFSMSSLFATHPPLEERIRAIDSAWDGKLAGGPAPAPATARFDGRVSALNSLGDSDRIDLRVGGSVRDSLPGIERTRTKDEAKALMFGLLLAEDDELRSGEESWLRERMGADVTQAASAWNRELLGRSSAEKIALIDLSLPALRRMSREEFVDFGVATQCLIESDGEVTLFEFMLRKVLQRHLESAFGTSGIPRIRFRELRDVTDEVTLLARNFARLGGDPAALAVAEEEFKHGGGGGFSPGIGENMDLVEIDAALTKLDAASPVVKRLVLRICGMAAVNDGILSDREAELLRATADAIGASLPPFVRFDA